MFKKENVRMESGFIKAKDFKKKKRQALLQSIRQTYFQRIKICWHVFTMKPCVISMGDRNHTNLSFAVTDDADTIVRMLLLARLEADMMFEHLVESGDFSKKQLYEAVDDYVSGPKMRLLIDKMYDEVKGGS